jgi:probable phosphoglycerate mutase
MKILFCRHGETLWNQQGRLQGHLDSELSVQGVQQARQLGAALTSYKPCLMMTSDLGRAALTAELANESLNIAIQASPLLRERCFGELQGLHRGESKHLWQAYEQRFNTNDMAVQHAESAAEVLNRVKRFLTSISELDFDTLIVICHGEWLRILQNSVHGLAPWSDQLPLPNNCQIIEHELS